MTTDPFYKQPPQRKPEEGESGVNETNADDVNTLRTLKDDVEQMVEEDHISTAEIAIAEQQRRRERGVDEKPEKKNRTRTKISISVILVILGAAIILLSFKYNFVPQSVKNLVGLGGDSKEIITKESKITISTDNKNSLDIKREVANKIQTTKDDAGKIVEFELTKTKTITKDDETREVETSISVRDLFKILESTADDRLIRSMQMDFLLGIYTGFENTPFLILKTSDINLSFSEMYSWEEKMYYELKPLLSLKDEVPEFLEIEVASSTATSTATATATTSATTSATILNSTSTPTFQKIENPDPKFNPKEFSDLVIANRDVRAIVDEAGEVILMYSFVDNENIIFTDDIEVFKELVQRIISKKLVR